MDESHEYMLDEVSAPDLSASLEAQDGAELGDSVAELDSLIAKLNDEIAHSASLLPPLEELDLFDSMSGTEFGAGLPPLLDFESFAVAEDEVLGEITADIEAAEGLPAMPEFGDATEDETKFELPPLDEVELGGADMMLASAGVTSELEVTGGVASPEEQSLDSHNDSDVVRANNSEASNILDSIIAEIDRETAPSAGSAEAQIGTTAPAVGSAVATEQHVIFSLGGTAYSFPIANVLEIGRPLAVTPLPNVPDWVVGVANLRGDIISVVDLRRFLGMAADDSLHAGRMLVVRSKIEEIQTALIVDAVRGIRLLDGGRVAQPTAPLEDGVTPYMRGVYEHKERLLVLLDPEKLMLSPEMRRFEAVSSGG